MNISSIRSKLDVLSAAVGKNDPDLTSCAAMLTELKVRSDLSISVTLFTRPYKS